MYTAKITKVKEEFGVTKVTVEYTKGNDVVEENYQLTESKGIEDLKSIAKQRINELEVKSVKPAKIKTGDLDLSDPVVEPVVLTPKQIAEREADRLETLKWNEYKQKLSELKNKKEFVNLGILEEVDIATLKDEVKALAIELKEI